MNEVNLACSILGTTLEALGSNYKTESLATSRAIIAYHLHDNLGYSLNTIAKVLKYANHSALSIARQKIRDVLKMGTPYQLYTKVMNFFITYSIVKNGNIGNALYTLLSIGEMYELLESETKEKLSDYATPVLETLNI